MKIYICILSILGVASICAQDCLVDKKPVPKVKKMNPTHLANLTAMNTAAKNTPRVRKKTSRKRFVFYNKPQCGQPEFEKQ